MSREWALRESGPGNARPITMTHAPSLAACDMIGVSPASQRVRHLADRIAPTDRHLLICGPTGTGKEVVARRVHLHGRHADAPFIDVNCGAIPENLLESEFFGHARGAFTGATGYRPGFLQQVGRGTLFLDEIGELPLMLQPKLLRVLETRSFRPVGSSELIAFEGRIVAATHRDLLQMVREGRFREDLFYRLAVFVVELPGLNQRKEDIPGLVTHFAARQTHPLTFTPEAMQQLCQHDWPGNIRQLRNLIDQLGVLADSPRIDVATLTPYLQPVFAKPETLDILADALLELPGADKLEMAQDLLTNRALQRSNGNKSAAAQILGVSRKTVERRLKAREHQQQEIDVLLAQARQAVDDGAFRQAIPLLRRAVELASDGQRRFEVFRLLGVSLRNVNGWLCQEALACDQTAFAAGADNCDAFELSTLQFGIWSTQLMTLELAQARATAQDMLQRAQGSASPPAQDEAHVAMANTLFWLGDSEEALACLGRGGLPGATAGQERMGIQGFDLTSLALTLEGLATFQRGRFDQAQQAMVALQQRAGMLHHLAFNRAIALHGATWLATLFEAKTLPGELATTLESLSQAHGFTFYQGLSQIFRGYHLARQGQHNQADQAMQDGYQQHMLRHGGKLFHSFQAWQRGEVLLQAGHATRCLSMIGPAIDLALEHQERAYLGELLVIRARALWAQGKTEAAEQELRNAMSTAMVLGSTPARLATAYQLGQMLHQRGQPAQALEALNRALRGTEQAGEAPLLSRVRQLRDSLHTGLPH